MEDEKINEDEINQIIGKYYPEKHKTNYCEIDLLTLKSEIDDISKVPNVQRKEVAKDTENTLYSPKNYTDNENRKSSINQKKRSSKLHNVLNFSSSFESMGGSEQFTENIQEVKKSMSAEDCQMISACLKGSYVFYALKSINHKFILEEMKYYECQENQFVFKQGQAAQKFFIIEAGEVEVYIDDKLKKSLAKGASFGELALLYDAPRSATVKVKGKKAGFWVLDRTKFKEVVQNQTAANEQQNVEFMATISCFEGLSQPQKEMVARNMITIKATKGEKIVNQGDSADSFYIIKEGKVSVRANGKEIRKMGQNESFGESALFDTQQKRGADVIAYSDVIMLTLGKDHIQKVLGKDILSITWGNKLRWSFSKCKDLSKLSNLQVEKVCRNVKIKDEDSGTVLLQKGKTVEHIYFVLQGSLKIKNNSIKEGYVFGDQYVLQSNQQKHLEEGDLTSDGHSIIGTISFKEFERQIGGHIETVLENIEKGHEYLIQKQRLKELSKIKIEELILIKELGSGQFGHVYLVAEQKQKNKLYALKSIDKGATIKHKQQRFLVNEKRILSSIDFPFTMNYHRSFKDFYSVYFLLEFINGMELFDVIREIGILTRADSQFYIGTMILCMEYLHHNHIIYRDLKPENVMVDNKGCMYLIDMGTGKNLHDKDIKIKDRTFTIIGTPQYMAPEVIQGKGYSYFVDLWSIGVCLYEFMVGDLPFGSDLEDPFQVYNLISNVKKVDYPDYFTDPVSKSLMNQLMNTNPLVRRGHNYANLKAHQFFNGFDWDKLYHRQIKPPYVPPSKMCLQQKVIDEGLKKNIPVTDSIKKNSNEKMTEFLKKADTTWDSEF